MSKEKEDPLAGGREIKPSTVSFGKPGNYIKGTYVGSKIVPTSNGARPMYELKGLIGEYNPTEKETDDNGNSSTKILSAETVVAGDFYNVWGGKQVIDDGFRKVKVGTVVGIQFVEAKKSKTAGHAAFKIFRFKEYGPDATYAGEDSNEMITVENEGTPF